MGPHELAIPALNKPDKVRRPVHRGMSSDSGDTDAVNNLSQKVRRKPGRRRSKNNVYGESGEPNFHDSCASFNLFGQPDIDVQALSATNTSRLGESFAEFTSISASSSEANREITFVPPQQQPPAAPAEHNPISERRREPPRRRNSISGERQAPRRRNSTSGAPQTPRRDSSQPPKRSGSRQRLRPLALDFESPEKVRTPTQKKEKSQRKQRTIQMDLEFAVGGKTPSETQQQIQKTPKREKPKLKNLLLEVDREASNFVSASGAQQRPKAARKELATQKPIMVPVDLQQVPKSPNKKKASLKSSEQLNSFFTVQSPRASSLNLYGVRKDSISDDGDNEDQAKKYPDYAPYAFDNVSTAFPESEFSVAFPPKNHERTPHKHGSNLLRGKQNKDDEKTISTSSTTNSSENLDSSQMLFTSSALESSPTTIEEEDEDSDDDSMDASTHVLAAQYAAVAFKKFDAHFALKNSNKEKSVFQFCGPELILASQRPIRELGHYVEYQLQSVQIIMDLVDEGQFGSTMEQCRDRFMDRSMDGTYCVRVIKSGLTANTDIGPIAAADIAMEVRILQNLPGHPNISPLYGMSRKQLVESLKNGGKFDSELPSSIIQNSFFMITDRVRELLSDRVDSWRHKQGYNDSAGSKLSQRLEVALDISSALSFLHDREIVYHPRPEKIGFDAKHSCVKLFSFSEARQEDMSAQDQSRFITKSKDVSTLAYAAPEMLCNAPITCSSDVYGFGILLWQIISLKTPFEGLDRKRHFSDVVMNHHRPIISGKWPHDVGKLLEGCWDPYLRMTMKKANESLESILLF